MTSQQIAKRNQAVGTLKELFEKARPSIEAVIPKHLSPDRLLKVALVAVSQTPKLQECSATSVLQAVMTAVQLGLDPGGVTGEAYMVPYGNKCQLIPGYRGLLKLARNGKTLSAVRARVVHANDEFEYEDGIEIKLRHKPNLAEPGPPILAYFVADFVDGGHHVEVMTWPEIMAIRKRSKASGNGPWVTDTEEMAKKTVTRRACKWLDLSPELAAAVAVEDRAEGSAGAIGLVDVGLPDEVIDAELVAEDEPAEEIEPPRRKSAKAGEQQELEV